MRGPFFGVKCIRCGEVQYERICGPCSYVELHEFTPDPLDEGFCYRCGHDWLDHHKAGTADD